MFWVYILECSNNAYYCGYTNNLQKRFQSHREGKGAKYTKSFKPLRICQAWRVFVDKSIAMKAEVYIKALSRKEKEELIIFPKLLVDLFGKELIAVEPSIDQTSHL